MRVGSMVGLLMVLLSSPVKAQDSTMVVNNSILIYHSDTVKVVESVPILSQISRPKIYDKWIRRIADCEGLPVPPQAEIDKFRFYVVNAESFTTANGLNAIAATYNDQHVMILSWGTIWDYSVVAHEWLHFLLSLEYGPIYEHTTDLTVMHPSKYFDRCNIHPR